MKLEDIGFYTLSNKRAACASQYSPLYRCELILTDRCNFKCPYCRGVKREYQKDLELSEAVRIITEWQKHNLKNIRFSGGEPTLYEGLVNLVTLAKKTCEHIAISTNGSANFEVYEELIHAGVNDFSISLDACCAETFDKMANIKGMSEKVIDNIRKISQLTYTTIGVVLTPNNVNETDSIIKLGDALGVKDIRLIPAAQWKYNLDPFRVSDNILDKYPILKYRFENLKNEGSVRGLEPCDTRCHLVLDDMAVIGEHHYPCIIYLREQGDPIGRFMDIENVRAERAEWSRTHDVYADPICRNNCLDVCKDYGRKWNNFHSHI